MPCSRRTAPRAFGFALLILAAGIGSALAQTEAMNATKAQRTLDGRWAGDATTWVVDAQRLQVNTNPDMPFEWKSLQIVNVSGRMVIFDVGKTRYIALLPTDDTLQLTSLGVQGEKFLRRMPR